MTTINYFYGSKYYLKVQRNNTDQMTDVSEISYFLLTNFQKNNSIVSPYVQYTVQDKLLECFAKSLARLHKRKKERFKKIKLQSLSLGHLDYRLRSETI